MEELRVDVSKLSKEEAAIWREEEINVWKFNHALPYSDEYNTLLAANVQLISNNHDLDNRPVITCLPIHIKTARIIKHI